ncbi:MAG: EpsG family protein [Muribaculaceae bacterium]|nr:EpsG family protein [Muribaculaceae bacterium]
MEYLGPILLTIIGIIFKPRFKSEAPVKVWMGVICIYIILIIGLRYRVGTDTFIYMDRFERIPPLDEIFSRRKIEMIYEPGYFLINSICKCFSREFWPVQIVMATITSTCIFTFLYRTCKNVFVGIFLYLIFQWLFFGTEVMRESAAVGIFLVGYKYIDERKTLWKYFIFCGIAVTIHYSALITFFFPLIRNWKFNYWFIGVCLVMLMITPLVETLNKLMVLGTITSKIAFYIKDSINLNMNFRIMEFIRNGISALFILWVYRYSKMDCKYRALLLLQIAMSCGAFALPIIFSRFSDYTTLFMNVALANYVCTKAVDLRMRVFAVLFVILTQGYHYYKLYPERCFPYVSIFDPYKVPEREELFREIWKAH